MPTVALLVWMSMANAAAGPVAFSLPDLRDLISTSDVIILADFEGETAPLGAGVLRLSVDRLLKGRIAKGERLQMQWHDPPSWFLRGRAHRGKGLFFLDRGPGRALLARGTAPIEFSYFYVPEGPMPPAFRAPARATLKERIFLILAWAGRAPLSSSTRSGRRASLVRDFPIHERTPFQRSFLRSYASGEGGVWNHLAAAALLARLQEDPAAALVTIHHNRAALARAVEWHSLLKIVTWDMRDPNPKVVAALASLAARGPDRELRVAAATALADIHTVEALPHLARLMDDPDGELQALGVGGLAMFANNTPVGSLEPAPGDWKYRTEGTLRNAIMSADVIARDPGRYLGFWRNWWWAHGRQLAGSAVRQ